MPDNEMNADDEFNGVVDRIAEQFARTTVQIDLLCAVDRLVSTAQERGRREGLEEAARYVAAYSDDNCDFETCAEHLREKAAGHAS